MAKDIAQTASLERVEDAALLSGAARFFDDLLVPGTTVHATIVRSPHAHARIISVNTDLSLIHISEPTRPY